MQNINVKIPVDVVRNAVEIVKAIVAENAKVEEAIRALPPVSEEQDGKKGMETRSVVLKICEKYRADACKNAQDKLDALYKQYQAAIDDQTTPSGKALESEDYALFRDGLIVSPEQLTRILQKNDSITFAYAAEQYAKRRGWDGYEVRTNEGQAREFGNQVFNTCSRGVRMPGGYFSLYAREDDFLNRMADVSGLDDSFLKTESEAGAEGAAQ